MFAVALSEPAPCQPFDGTCCYRCSRRVHYLFLDRLQENNALCVTRQSVFPFTVVDLPRSTRTQLATGPWLFIDVAASVIVGITIKEKHLAGTISVDVQRSGQCRILASKRITFSG